MKKQILLTSLFMAISLMVFTDTQGQEAEFKPSGKPLAVIFTDFSTTFSDGQSASGFNIERAYLGYEYSFTSDLKARVIFDIGDPGAGKLGMVAFPKNVYLEYSPGKLTIAAGMIGTTYFRTQEKYFSYRYIVRSFQDIARMSSSADIGISLDYDLGKIGSVDLMIVNGEGFKSVQKDSTYRIATGLNLTPVDGLIIRGAFDITPGDNAQQTAMIYGSYGFGPARLGIEYSIQNNSGMVADRDLGGYAIFFSADVSKKMTAFARYDQLSSVTITGATDPWNIARDGSMLLLGFDISPAKGIRLSPNYKGWFPANGNPAVSTISINLEVKF